MSYPIDLDELTDEQLDDELRRRRALRKNGLCSYCGRASDTPSCKFDDRHMAPALEATELVGYRVRGEIAEGDKRVRVRADVGIGNRALAHKIAGQTDLEYARVTRIVRRV